jgi:hypothetical protein
VTLSVRRPGLVAGAAFLLLAGCSAPVKGLTLEATLTTPTDVTLSWPGDSGGAAGQAVEFATAADGDYAILQYVPDSVRTYKHPNLIPDTTFFYRLVPYFGPVSNEVAVELPPGDLDEQEASADHSWARPQQLLQPPATQSAGAAPTTFTAKVMSTNGIRFTWTDHATDETGFLLESRPAGAADFTPIEVIDPNANSVGIVTLPAEKMATYRVRAFHYGTPSHVVTEKTGRASE